MIGSLVPDIGVEKTISHPEEPDRVIGFEARDKKRGFSCLLMKAEELPRANAEVGIPADQARAVEEDDSILYVLLPDTLIGFSPEEFETHSTLTDLEWDGLTTEMMAVDPGAGTVWHRDEISVGAK